MGINNIRGSLSSNIGKEDKKTMKEKLRNALGTSFLVVSLSACVDGGGSSNNDNNEPINDTKDAATIEVIDDAVKNGEFDVKTLTGKDIFDETLKTDENGQIVLTQSQVDTLLSNIGTQGLGTNDYIIFLNKGGEDSQGQIKGNMSLIIKVSDISNLTGDETFRITPTSTFIEDSVTEGVSGDTIDLSNKVSTILSEGGMSDVNNDGYVDRKDMQSYNPTEHNSTIEDQVRNKTDYLKNIRNGNSNDTEREGIESNLGIDGALDISYSNLGSIDAVNSNGDDFSIESGKISIDNVKYMSDGTYKLSINETDSSNMTIVEIEITTDSSGNKTYQITNKKQNVESTDASDYINGNISFENANEVPTAKDVTADAGGAGGLAYDMNPEISDKEDSDSQLNIEVVSQPSEGSLAWGGNNGNEFGYNCTNSGYEGSDSFTYKVIDSDDGESEIKTVNIINIDNS